MSISHPAAEDKEWWLFIPLSFLPTSESQSHNGATNCQKTMADWSLLQRLQATSGHGASAISQMVGSARSHHLPRRVVFSVGQSPTSNPVEKARQNHWCSQATMERDSVLDFPFTFSYFPVSKCLKPYHIYFCTLATPLNPWWTLTFCHFL